MFIQEKQLCLESTFSQPVYVIKNPTDPSNFDPPCRWKINSDNLKYVPRFY